MTEIIEQVMANAECIYSEAEVESAIDAMANSINSKMSGLNPIVISVMNGGLVFAGKLLTKLTFPLQVDYCHASRYQNDMEGGELLWKVLPQMDLADRNILVVDDIYDQGHTLQSILTALQAQGANSIMMAVLVNKLHDRKALTDFSIDFVGLEVPDKFVFGYGMDYRGYLRNAAGIYAVCTNQ